MPSYTQKKQKACYMQSMDANSETCILLILPSLINIFYLKKKNETQLDKVLWVLFCSGGFFTIIFKDFHTTMVL